MESWLAPDQREFSHWQDRGQAAHGEPWESSLTAPGTVCSWRRWCSSLPRGFALCFLAGRRAKNMWVLLSQHKKTPLEFGYFRITVRHPLHALIVLKLCISEAARGSIFILLCWALSPFLPVLLLLSACKTNYSKYSLIRARLLNSQCVFVCTC